MARTDSAGSLTEQVYQQIRQDLFRSEFRPGDRIAPGELGARYEVSTTVVREALAVLAGERLLVSKSGKGYFVPEVTVEELEGLTFVRCLVEEQAVRLSMERGGVEWESEVVAAHHRLRRTPRYWDDGQQNPDWSRVHREFHHVLVSKCGVQPLINVCRDVEAATIIYGVWLSRLPREGAAKRDEEHDLILEAVLAGDPDRAAELLADHHRSTTRELIPLITRD